MPSLGRARIGQLASARLDRRRRNGRRRFAAWYARQQRQLGEAFAPTPVDHDILHGLIDLGRLDETNQRI